MTREDQRLSAAYSVARTRLAAVGLRASWNDIAEISHDFALTRLPRAIKSFDPQKGAGREKAWLQTVFARYAQRALLADSDFRSHLDLLESIDAPAPASNSDQ